MTLFVVCIPFCFDVSFFLSFFLLLLLLLLLLRLLDLLLLGRESEGEVNFFRGMYPLLL